jgi:hypothetical protein
MPISAFPALFRSSIFFMNGNTSGTWPDYDIPRQKKWIPRHQPKLDSDQIEKLARFLRGIDASTPTVADSIRIEASYFERNADRMHYPEFRRRHLFVSSGVIAEGTFQG